MQKGHQTMLDSALEYARRGWRVLPCAARGKVPLTEHGCRDASIDEAVVRAWWARWPHANIGIATGIESNLVVLDVDVADDKRGDESLVSLVMAHGGLGDTLHVLTGTGGSHYYFSHPGAPVSNSAQRLGRGLDIRGDGGYVIAHPSVHANGARYSLCRGGELQPMPEWLISLLRPREVAQAPIQRIKRPRTEALQRAVRYLDSIDAAISGSGGHQALWRAALALVRGFGLSPDDALDLLVFEYNPRCKPAWSLQELEHKVRQASDAKHVSIGYLIAETQDG